MGKKLETGSLDDLDFDFGAFDDSITHSVDPSSKSTSRSPVGRVIKGVLGGAKDSALSGYFVRETLKKTLPSTYGEIAEGVNQVAKAVYESQNEAKKELKPRLGRIVETLGTLVPENMQKTKALIEKLEERLIERDRSTSIDESQAREAAIGSMMNEVFENQRKYEKRQEARAIVSKAESLKRDVVFARVLGGIENNTSMLAQYTIRTNAAFQRRSLELQLRSHLELKEHTAIFNRYFEAFRLQNEALIKNTSLPDYAKLKTSERIMESMRGKVFDNVSDRLFGKGSALTQALETAKQSASDFIQGAGQGLERASFGLEMAANTKEQLENMNEIITSMGGEPITREEMIGSMAGGSAINWLRDEFAKRIKPGLDKNNKLQETLAKTASRFRNLPGFLNSIRESEKWKEKTYDYSTPMGQLFNFLDATLERMGDNEPFRRISSGTQIGKLDEPVPGMSRRFSLSVTDVMPGYLAAIHRELVATRTGNDNVDSMRFDYERGEFTGSKKLRERLKSRLSKMAENSSVGYYAGNAVKNFVGDEALTDDVELNLRIFFSRLARIPNLDYTADNIRSLDLYDVLDPETKALVDRRLDRLFSGDEIERNKYRLTSDVRNLRESMPSLSDEITGYTSSGYADLLRGIGALKRDRRSGDLEIDEEWYRRLLEGEGVIKSDIHAKKNISGMTSTGVLSAFNQAVSGRNPFGDKWDPRASFEGLRKSKLYNYNYKDGFGDSNLHIGPMAQDIQKNLGSEAAPGGTSIDLQSMNGITMAAIDHLGDRIDQIEKGAEGATVVALLKKIQKDIRFIRENGGGMGGGGGGGGRGSLAGKDGSYAEILGNLLNQASTLAGKGLSDTLGFARRTAQGTQDKILSPLAKFMGEKYDKYNGPAREAMGKFIERTFEVGASLFEQGKNFVTNTVPESARAVKSLLMRGYKKVSEWMGTQKDLYFPDGAEPVIRAVKLKMGFYRDELTGKALTTVDELIACKGNVTDSMGNIIVTAKELAEGLYDAHGEKVRSTLANVIGTGLRVGAYVKEKFTKGLSTLMEAGGSVTNRMSKWWNESDFGVGFSSKKTHDVIVDIRDILLGRKHAVMKRLSLKKSELDADKDSKSDKGSGDIIINEAGDVVSSPGTGTTVGGFKIPSIQGLMNRFKKTAQDALNVAAGGQTSDFVGPPTREAVAAGNGNFVDKLGRVNGRVSDIFSNLRKRFKLPGGQGDFVGPMPQTAGTDGFVGPLRPTFGQKASGAFSKLRGGLMGGLSKGASFLGGLGSFFGGGNSDAPTEMNGPDMSQQMAADKAAAERNAEKKESIFKRIAGYRNRKEGDADGDGVKDGSVADRQKQLDEAKARNVHAAADVDLTSRYKSSENVIDMIMRRFNGTFDFLTKSIGGVVELATSALGAIPLGKLLSGGIKGAGKLLAGGIKAGGKLGISGARVAGSAALGAGRVALGVGGRVLLAAPAVASATVSAAATVGTGVLGTAATAIMGIVGSPVFLTGAAIAGTSAVGYWLYKYVTKDDADEFQTIRLKQYGMLDGACNSSYNHYALTLENYLLDGRVGYNNGEPYILEKKVSPQDLLDMFRIDKDDVETANEFAMWYAKRFKPFFLNSVAAAYRANPKISLTEIGKEPASVILRYLETISYESGPYDEVTSPFKAVPALSYEKAPILEAIKSLISKYADKAKGDESAKSNKETHNGMFFFSKRREEERRKAEEEARAKKPEKSETAAERFSQVLANANRSQNETNAPTSPGQGDGPRTGASASIAAAASAALGDTAPSAFPMAGGKVSGGEAAMPFIRLKNGVNLNDLHPGVLKHFLGMVEEYGNATGKPVNVTDAFRSYADQARLYKADPSKAARPGYSMHELGLAIDISPEAANEMDKLGLMKKYGFTRPVGGENWHIEPAGIQTNLGLARSSPTDRDVMVEASLFKGGGGYGSMPGSDLGRRNNALAMRLLGVEPKAPETTVAKVNKKIDAAMGIAANDDSKGSIPASTGSAYAASNNMVDRKKPGPAFSSQGEAEKTVSSGSVASASPAANGDVMGAIEKGSEKAGVDPNLMKVVAAMESDLKPGARANGAEGLYGFRAKTWDYRKAKVANEFGLDQNSGPTDPHASSVVAATYMRDNLRAISDVKPNPGIVDGYLTMLLGPTGAKRFFRADPNEIAANVLPGPAEAPGNRNLFFAKDGRPFTIGEMYQVITEKIRQKATQHGLNVDLPTTNKPTSGTMVASADKKVLPFGSPSSAKEASTPSSISDVLPKPNSGGFFSNSPRSAPETSRATPSSISFSTAKMEESLDKSLGVLQEIRDTVKELPENLARALADKAAESSRNQNSPGNKPNMVQTKLSPNIDLRRQA